MIVCSIILHKANTIIGHHILGRWGCLIFLVTPLLYLFLTVGMLGSGDGSYRRSFRTQTMSLWQSHTEKTESEMKTSFVPKSWHGSQSTLDYHHYIHLDTRWSSFLVYDLLCLIPLKFKSSKIPEYRNSESRFWGRS
jgi:hypothetical protein